MKKIWILIGTVVIIMLVSETGLADDQILLVSPGDGDIVKPTPLFRWEKLSYSTKYTLEISKSDGFEEPFLTVQGIENSRWGIPQDWETAEKPELEEGIIYYWRVRSDAGKSESEARSFRVGFSLRVKVADEEGNPIERALVSLKIDNMTISEYTDTNGIAIVYGFGECSLTISCSIYPSFVEKTQLDKSGTKDCILTDKGTLLITVKSEMGEEVNNATVTVLTPDGDVVDEFNINTGYSAKIKEGQYSFEVAAKGFNSARKEDVWILAYIENQLEIMLEKIRYSTTVIVEDLDGNPIKSAEVFLDNTPVGITDDNGKLEMKVAYGKHQFLVLTEGRFQIGNEEADIPSSGPVKIGLTPIAKGEPTLSGIILSLISISLTAVLLVFYIRMKSTLKEMNSKFDKIIKNQEAALKENKKDVDTMMEYISDILERT
jgi:hypothetical protein